MGRPARTFRYNGEEKTLAEWSAVTGLSVKALKARLERGWTVWVSDWGRRWV